MTEFKNLERQSVRDYWTDEARNFTPWLAEQIDSDEPSEIEDTMQIDLSLQGIEQSVGRYNLDILAEADDGRIVVIENQLESSDHDHLGKCLAYASGVDADIIVWISPEFNDEHTDAFQWLNNHTQEGIDLFALRLEVLKIGDSSPAVQFTPLEEPSEWKAQAQRSTELTDTKKLYLEFWSGFRDAIEAADTPLSPRKPFPENWYNNPIGRSGMKLQFKISVQNESATAQFVIDDSPEVFEELQEDAKDIGQNIQGDVRWYSVEESPDRSNRSRVAVTRGIDLDNKSQWPEYHEWLLERGAELHRTFAHRIRGLDV